MHFKRVEVSHFRNLTSASFLPSPSINLIFGSNGSGKSSLLEALHYLATGSSFRAHRLTHIIEREQECSTLFAEITNGVETSYRIGLKRCRKEKAITRINGEDIARRSALVQLSPLQLISPESISLLVDGSEYRRSFIDWALFHVEHSFHYHTSHYTRALKQRNALLKTNNKQQIEQWNQLLVDHGIAIDQLRREYVTTIVPIVTPLLSQILPELQFSYDYKSGWSSDYTLNEALIHAYETDIKMRHTTVGPHRSDLVIRSDGIKVTEILSRGQLKLVVMALKLAQIMLFTESQLKPPVILIDDIAAELDEQHRVLLLQTLKNLNSQIFITTPQESLVDLREWGEKRVFHVEHGDIKEVV